MSGWVNLTFFDLDGRDSEVDVLLLTRRGFFVVELKGWHGDITGNLGPTDGMISIGLAATYTMDNMKITGGIRYVEIGDATTKPPISGVFTGNSGVGVGVKIGYTF